MNTLVENKSGPSVCIPEKQKTRTAENGFHFRIDLQMSEEAGDRVKCQQKHLSKPPADKHPQNHINIRAKEINK